MSNWRCFGGRVHPGRDYVSQATQSRPAAEPHVLTGAPYGDLWVPLITSAALAAGFIPAATMSLKPPSVAPSGFGKIETQRYFGGRVHPGRDYVSQATQRCLEWLSKKSKPYTGKRAAPAAKPHGR